MAGASAYPSLLLDTRSSIVNFLVVFIYVYVLCIIIYVLTSWIRLPYSPWTNRIQRFLYDVCEPYLRLFRRVIPPFGPLDLSPVIATLVLMITASVLERFR